MRFTFIKTVFLTVICLAFIATLLARANDSAKLTKNGMITTRTRAVISGENAYVLGPVETIADVMSMDKIVTSPDNSAVLVAAYKSRPYSSVALAQADVEAGMSQRLPELNLIYWDARTRVAKTLLRETNTPNMVSAIGGIHWIPQTRIALVTLGRASITDQTETLSLMRVDATAGTIRRVTDLKQASRVAVSPSQPLAYIASESDQGASGQLDTPLSLQIYTPQGLGRVIQLDVRTGPLEWAMDGKSVYSTKIIERTPQGKLAVRKHLTSINLETGAITHPEKLPTVQDNKSVPSRRAEWPLSPVVTTITVPDPTGERQVTNALWLQGEGLQTKPTNAAPPAPANKTVFIDALLVATNARIEGYVMSQNTAAILFTRDGSLCAAPIFRLPKAAFEQGLRTAQRQTTISNAKQVGLGMIMYAQDYDSNYPVAGTGVAKVVEPYLKSRVVFDNPATGEPGFVYTHSGSTALAEITEPATTQLGYVSGPGGRAIIWADGHVTWQDD